MAGGGGPARRVRSAGEARAGAASPAPRRSSASQAASRRRPRSGAGGAPGSAVRGRPASFPGRGPARRGSLPSSRPASPPSPQRPAPAAKPIALRKIVPRGGQVGGLSELSGRVCGLRDSGPSRAFRAAKTQSPFHGVFSFSPTRAKEAAVAPRRSPRISLKEDKENVPTRATEVKSPGGGDVRTKLEPFPLHCSSMEPAADNPQGGTAVLSPISVNMHDSPSADQRDLAMAKRVRRSYSRLEISLVHTLDSSRSPGSSLADTSTPDHSLDKRRTFFGFEKLLLSDEVPGVSPVNASAPQKVAEAVGGADVLQELDTDIPGIAFGKEKRRKKKMPQFDKSELDQWAAQMNAEFEEAERFSLHVE